MKQKESAQYAMIEWLASPNELGKKPAKIQCTKQFEYLEMNYYIFKFKKSLFSKWMIGVCGGYEEDSTDHCGHVFSNFQQYDQKTEEKDVKEMVDYIRNYWMQRAIP